MSEPPLLVGEDIEKEYRVGPELVRVLRGATVGVGAGEWPLMRERGGYPRVIRIVTRRVGECKRQEARVLR